MKRNMLKAIEEYKQEFWINRKGREGVFFLEEIMQIKESLPINNAAETVYDAITKGLMAGYMLGYRKALKDVKKRAKGQATK